MLKCFIKRDIIFIDKDNCFLIYSAKMEPSTQKYGFDYFLFYTKRGPETRTSSIMQRVFFHYVMVAAMFSVIFRFSSPFLRR